MRVDQRMKAETIRRGHTKRGHSITAKRTCPAKHNQNKPESGTFLAFSWGCENVRARVCEGARKDRVGLLSILLVASCLSESDAILPPTAKSSLGAFHPLQRLRTKSVCDLATLHEIADWYLKVTLKLTKLESGGSKLHDGHMEIKIGIILGNYSQYGKILIIIQLLPKKYQF